ncbi:MAG: hypothetical protein HYR63_19375 [Proteobacteria bacterium]|nr:hypothetical protein [Pseudomonadota bacterium]
MAIDTKPRPIVLYTRSEEIEELVSAFRTKTLPLEHWSHQAHLTVGIWHLVRMSAGEATPLIREGISRYNESQGVPNSDSRGYHETITRFYIWAIGKYLEAADRSRTLLDLTNGLIVSPHGSKDHPFRYYSRERLLSVEARRGWVEPDLAALD